MALELISRHLSDEGEDMVICWVGHAVGYTELWEVETRQGVDNVSPKA